MEITGKDASGTSKTLLTRKDGSMIVASASTKYQETVLKGNTYSVSVSNMALIAANAIVTAVDATAKPIIGIYNPSTSNKNLVILQSVLSITKLSDSAVAPGGFMWVGSSGNAGISTGTTNVGVNLLNLKTTGSVSYMFTGNIALTGLTNSLSNIRPVSVPVINAAGSNTATPFIQGNVVDQVDGMIIVPPGGIVGIMNQVSTTTIYVSASIVWAEQDV